jgi:hypothetical protein
MKKHIYFLTCILFSFCFYGQIILTNGMLYNYSVGDTLQYEIPTSSCTGIPSIHTRTILQKNLLVDTINYLIKDEYYDNCGGCFPIGSGSNTYSLQITNLNSNAQFNTYSSNCLSFSDTAYIDGCGKNVNERRFIYQVSTNCDIISGHDYLIEGLGEFYSGYIKENGDPCYRAKRIICYQKMGESRCGNCLSFTGIKDYLKLKDILICPTPSINSEISILNNERQKLYISISTIEGKEVYKNESNDLVIKIKHEFLPGVYFVKFQLLSGEAMNKKMIIQ